MWCCGLGFLFQALVMDDFGRVVGEDTDSHIVTVL